MLQFVLEYTKDRTGEFPSQVLHSLSDDINELNDNDFHYYIRPLRMLCQCLFVKKNNSCNGDSGGPLMLPLHAGNGSFPFYQIGKKNSVVQIPP